MSWTLEQAAELALEHMLELLEGAADDDTIRPGLALDALHQAWSPATEISPLDEGTTVAEVRRRINDARARLAAGDTIP